MADMSHPDSLDESRKDRIMVLTGLVSLVLIFVTGLVAFGF